MYFTVVKRDGRIVDFDKVRIVKAIAAAADEVDSTHGLLNVNLARNKADEVIERIKEIYPDRERRKTY